MRLSNKTPTPIQSVSPGILPGKNQIYGEVYSINTEILTRLDQIEGYDPKNQETSLYIRREISVKLFNDSSIIKASTYFYNQRIPEYKKIPYGDYRRYRCEATEKLQWYIAYGSNISAQRLQSRIKIDGPKKIGYLEGYELIFNKKGNLGENYANVRYRGANYHCPCVAYKGSLEQLSTLDHYEGEPQDYIRLTMPFRDLETQLMYLGQIYLANPLRLTSQNQISNHYLQHLYDGYSEHGFYCTSLPRYQQDD